MAVSTPDRLWLGGVAQEWDCESPPDDPRVTLVAVRPDEVLGSAATVLDLR